MAVFAPYGQPDFQIGFNSHQASTHWVWDQAFRHQQYYNSVRSENAS